MQKDHRTNAKLIAVQISEGFVPPSGFVRRVRAALSWIDAADLAGVEFVYLFDDVPSISPGKNSEVEEALREGLLLFASYKPRGEHWPAHIMLIVRNLCKPVPPVLRHSAALTAWLTENIAHEVGHHLIAEKKFTLLPRADSQQFETEEEFADRFAKSVTTRLTNRPSYRFARLLLDLAAAIDYYKGAHHWKKGKYQLAADYFYMATQLRPDHSQASYWFWKAKERATHLP